MYFVKIQNSLFLLQFATAHACASAQELQCLQLQSNRVSINAFAIICMFYFGASCIYDCRVQSLRRPDAAEKGNNVALIAVHGPFEGSVAIAASERVTLIQ